MSGDDSLVGAAEAALHSYHHGDLGRLADRAEQVAATSGLTDAESAGIARVVEVMQNDYIYGGAAARRAVTRLERVLSGESELAVDRDGRFGEAVLADLDSMAPAEREAWRALIAHAKTAKSSKPSRKWLGEADKRLANVGGANAGQRLADWFADVVAPGAPAEPFAYLSHPPLTDLNSDVLKGLCWAASRITTPEVIGAVGDLGVMCFKKVPSYGALSTKVGNACVWTLGTLPGFDGAAQLARMKLRVKYAQAQKLIDKALRQTAERAGLTPTDLEEMSVPTLGLDRDGRGEEHFSDVVARLALDAGGLSVTWEKGGRVVKNPPAEVKRDFPDQLKALKRKVKDAGVQLGAVRGRLERMMLEPREWTVETFRERYLDHPLVGHLARRLIWSATWPDGVKTLLATETGFVDAAGKPASLEGATAVRVWHPLGRPVEEVQALRRLLEERGVTQPFKQAHREIYVVTDAELATGTYSNRFASHVIRQHQFAALCRERGWTYTLQGGWDSHNVPYRFVSALGLGVEFWVEAGWEETNMSESGIFVHVVTDQVRFVRDGEVLPMADVPALAFSELMRDVDLFVGVCSVATDPTWHDRGPAQTQAYWHSYAFGELSATAETRREVLETLLPKLKIKDRARLVGRFLEVQGKLRTYKIHLGSGNILMLPNDQYLCIVPDRRNAATPKFLPFEGDPMLTIILSKALLLAADDKIRDQTILNQIRAM